VTAGRLIMTFDEVAALGRWLRKRAENVAVALLSTMFVCFIIQIIFRYVLNNPVGWTEEVIVTAWLWTVLWGAAFVVGEAEEVRFDIIYSNISETARRVCTILTGVVLVLLYGISLPASYKYVSFMKVERSAYLHVPINLMYSVYLVFAVACIGRYLWLVVYAIRGGISPLTDAARLGD
jgi:TRAP-type C4-dicarboxylate transport system permease small subunit